VVRPIHYVTCPFCGRTLLIPGVMPLCRVPECVRRWRKNRTEPSEGPGRLGEGTGRATARRNSLFRNDVCRRGRTPIGEDGDMGFERAIRALEEAEPWDSIPDG
jgi:hypothetical protein